MGEVSLHAEGVVAGGFLWVRNAVLEDSTTGSVTDLTGHPFNGQSLSFTQVCAAAVDVECTCMNPYKDFPRWIARSWSLHDRKSMACARRTLLPLETEFRRQARAQTEFGHEGGLGIENGGELLPPLGAHARSENFLVLEGNRLTTARRRQDWLPRLPPSELHG